MKMTAIQKLRKFCLYYIKQNYKELDTDTRFDNKQIIKEIKDNNEESIEWFLSEILRDDLIEKGIILESEWDKDGKYYVTIYKIGSAYIKSIFENYKVPVTFEFVKRKKKHVIVYEWVSK